ncbi:MAG: MFS transporter [Chloroflexota bacterium]
MSHLTASEPTASSRLPGGSSLQLALATLAFTVCFAVWGLFSPLAPIFRGLYGLNGTQVGILVAVPVLLGSLVRLPIGIATDRYGGRTVFTVLMLILVVPAAITGFTNSYVALLAIAFFLGLAGASFAVGVPFVAKWYPPSRQGFALGIYGMGNIGTAIASSLVPTVARGVGWPFAFWMFVPVLLAMAAVFWLFGRDAPSGRGAAASLADRLAVFRQNPLSWVLALFYFVTFGGFVAISIYMPTLLVGQFDLKPTDAGFLAAAFVILATLARPMGGYVSDRWGGTPVLNLAFAVVALMAILLAFEPGLTMIMGAFLSIAFVLGLGNGAVFKLVSQYFPTQTGTVTGLVGAAGGLGGFFPPILMGFVKDVTGSYAIAFMLLSEFAMVCLFINVLALQRRASRLAPKEE